jgi:hypothetical protein
VGVYSRVGNWRHFRGNLFCGNLFFSFLRRIFQLTQINHIFQTNLAVGESEPHSGSFLTTLNMGVNNAYGQMRITVDAVLKSGFGSFLFLESSLVSKSAVN